MSKISFKYSYVWNFWPNQSYRFYLRITFQASHEREKTPTYIKQNQSTKTEYVKLKKQLISPLCGGGVIGFNYSKLHKIKKNTNKSNPLSKLKTIKLRWIIKSKKEKQTEKRQELKKLTFNDVCQKIIPCDSFQINTALIFIFESYSETLLFLFRFHFQLSITWDF